MWLSFVKHLPLRKSVELFKLSISASHVVWTLKLEGQGHTAGGQMAIINWEIVNILRPKQNVTHVTDDISKSSFKENIQILIEFSPEFLF